MADSKFETWVHSMTKHLERRASSKTEAWEHSVTKHPERRASSTLTIPKVPKRIRRRDKYAYKPQIISFGPYHHGKGRLQAMEKHKRSFLEVILYFRPEIPRQRYINAIKEEAKIRTYYTDDFDMDSEEFVEMMLIDGCFLVVYFLKFYDRVPDQLDSMVWMHDLIRNDILLLENQLPFFILTKIFELLEFTPTFMDLAINYLKLVASQKRVNFPPPVPVQVNFRPLEPVHHLLHLYHSLSLYTQDGEGSPVSTNGEEPHPIYQPPIPTVLSEEEALIQVQEDESDSPSASVPHEAGGSLASTYGEESDHQTLSTDGEELDLHPPSATVLHEAGVKFEKKEVNGSSSLDVTFDNGKMMIPPLLIDTFKKSTLRNLVAFEQLYPNFSKEFNKSFTAYVEFMDFIVNTPEDVALLHKEGIIRHFLGSDEKVANFFNDLNQDVFVKSNHYLAPLYKNVHEYQKKPWPKWRATLMHNYCNSPWAVLGIVTGGILLVLTLLQTILSGLSA
ncbi:hypothetical protein AAC387_Pa12g1064 [Persea americana]